jgi:hypothetical protein
MPPILNVSYNGPMSENHEVTNARAIALAFCWTIGFALVNLFFTLPRLGGGVIIQLGMPICVTLAAALLVHRSWKVVLWMILVACALVALIWLLMAILFLIDGPYP